MDPAESQATYLESIVMKALTSEVVDHRGEFYELTQVSAEMDPCSSRIRRSGSALAMPPVQTGASRTKSTLS